MAGEPAHVAGSPRIRPMKSGRPAQPGVWCAHCRSQIRPGWKRAGVPIAMLLLTACGAGTARAPSHPLPPAAATAPLATSTSAPTATAVPRSILSPSATVPRTASREPTVGVPTAGTTDPAQEYLDAGTARLRAGDAAAAIHDEAIARALSPHRADIRAALAAAEEQLTKSPNARASHLPLGPTPIPTVPVRLIIPEIGVNAGVERVGLDATGGMDVPRQWGDVAWLQDGPVPGQAGNAAIDGHLDSTTGPAVFWRLGSLKPGDKLMVVLADEQSVQFIVRETARYPYNRAPMTRIFGPATSSNLILITCGGSWNAASKNYSQRIVVYATRA